jgi:D-proline reductase (dithiol) PrdB
MTRLKNQLIAKMFTRFPYLVERWVKKTPPLKFEDIPWTPVIKSIKDCKIAIVTTAGVHLKTQKLFDMHDPYGDPTYREIPANATKEQLMITHDYYDHKDADKDINIVYPVDRLQELKQAEEIGSIAEVHFGFMGHIDGGHIYTLINETAPGVAEKLRTQNVDAVLLTPG